MNSQRIVPIKLTQLESSEIWRRIYSFEIGNYTAWKEECRSNRAFYYGDQITPEEKEELKKRGQYEIAVNKIRKSIRNIVGMLSASLPQYQIVPMSSNDLHTAAIGNKAIRWVWKNSNGVNTFKRWIKNAAVDNMSYLFVYLDMKQRILFKLLSFSEVIPDPSSTDPFFEDATAIIIKRAITIENARTYYNVPNDIALTYEYSTPGPADMLDAQFTMFLGQIISTDRQYINLYEIYEKVYERSSDGTVQTRIRKKTVIGMNYVVSEMLPSSISEYPIIPLYVDKGENPYAKGEVFFVKDLQRFLNKCLGVTILNAQLMSSPKVFVHEHDIPNNDSAKFSSNFAKPGSVSVIADGAEFPLVISGQPLNSAFFTMYQDAKMEMDVATIPGQMNQDSDIGKPMDLFTHRQMVLDGFKDFMSNIEGAASQAGLVVLQYCRAYLQQGQLLRIMGEEDLQVRQSASLNLKDENSVKQWIDYQKKIGKDDEQITEELSLMKKDSDTIDAITYFINDLNFDDYDVSVIAGSYTPSYEFALLHLMLELQQRGIVDAATVIQYLPVENRQELIERFDEIFRLTKQLEQSQEEAANYKKLLDQQVSKSINDQIGLSTQRHDIKMTYIEKDARVKEYLNKHLEKLQSKEKINELVNGIAKILSEVEIEAEKQKIKIAAESMELPTLDELIEQGD